MKRKVPVRLLSFLLAGMMTVSSVQMPVYAAEVNTEQEAGTGEAIVEADDEEESGIKAEGADTSTEKTLEGMSSDTELEESTGSAASDADLSETAAAEEAAASDVTEAPDMQEDMESVETEEEEVLECEEPLNAVSNMVQPRDGETYRIIGNLGKKIYLKGIDKSIDTSNLKIEETSSTTTKVLNGSVVNIENFNPNSVGKQTVTITCESGAITVSGQFKVLVINPLPELEAEYGQKFSEIQLPADNFGTWSWSDGTKLVESGVGPQNYELNYIADDYSDYNERTVNAAVKVTRSLKKYATVVPKTLTYTYDGQDHEPKVTVTVGNKTLLEGTDYTLSYDNNKNAGTNASVIVTGIGNYKVKDENENKITATFTIEPAEVTITAKDLTIYCGDDKPSSYEIDIVGLADKERLQTPPVPTCPIPDTDVVARYTITVTPGSEEVVGGSDGTVDVTANYKHPFTYINGTLTVTKFIPANVEVTGITPHSKEYDGKEWSYDDKSQKVVYSDGSMKDIEVSNVYVVPSYSGTLSDDSEYDKPDAAPAEAGDYVMTFTLKGPDADKYALKAQEYRFQITQKEITLKAKPYTVKAGKSVPKIEDLINELKQTEKDGLFYVGPSTRAERELWEKASIKPEEFSLRYGLDDRDPSAIPSNIAGSHEIYVKYVNDNKINRNYRIEYEPAVLTVEGKMPFKAPYQYDFAITAAEMNYSNRKHSISGSAAGIGTYKIIVKGVTRNKESKVDDGWTTGDDPDDPEGTHDSDYNYKQKLAGIPAADIVEAYQGIAPIEVGDYTLKIFSEINDDGEGVYDYDGSALKKINFRILPLLKYETKLVGVAGVTNKIYDREVIDLSEQIRNARIITKQDIDITNVIKNKKRLKFWIMEDGSKDGEEDTGNSEGSGYKEEFTGDASEVDKMPRDAGKYKLVVRIEADESENYVTNEWSIPFVIKKRPLTVTIKDMKIPVGADVPDSSEYEYVITDDTITDEKKNILNNEDFDRPLIVPSGEVDTSKEGSYDLTSDDKIGDKGEKNGKNYEVKYVDGKLHIQTKLWGVKELNLTNNKNIPHGMTLEEIAEKYLPKTAVIYLSKDKTKRGTASIEWDTKVLASGVYKVGITSAQSFKMKGTLVLPDTVRVDPKDEDEGWLTVVVDVSVREADDGTQALKPYADIKGGTVGAGTRVGLYTDEEGAEIYYTVEADNPSLSVTSRRYTGPIEIKCTMTIRAVSRVKGKQDSEELRLTYYYNKNLKPGGADDPNDPSNPGVPDEDIPKGEDGKPLEIPKNMWVTDVAQCTYTGKAIKPQVRVYDYKTRLEENKDYTISYKNNINAADKNNPTKAPTIIIKGKGNYEGKINKTFTIAPKNINDVHEENSHEVYDVKMDDITVAFAENKNQKPVVAASWNGKKLVNKKDYTFEDVPYTAIGSYTVTVIGNGNYTGERKISFEITNATPASMFTVAKIPDYTYTGKEIKPTVIVTYNKVAAQQGLEYTLSYEDNVEIGTASVIIKGMRKFAGMKRVDFKIKEAAVLNKAQVELVFDSGIGTVYTGKEIKPSQIKMAAQVENNGAVETRILTENDYKVTYQNNVKAGTATAVFEGIGAYSGTLKTTFKISPYNIENMQPDQITVQAVYPYMKGGSTQKPVVQFDGKTLQEGTDYTLSYRNHTRVGNTAVMTIKGKGNFTGSVTRTYQVTVRDISNMTVNAADKVYQPKAKNYTTKVRVVDSNGKALVAGEDYDTQVAYTYAEKTTLLSGEVVNPGDPVAVMEMLPAGVKIRVTVTAIGKNFQGTAAGTFSMVQADVAKAKVTVPAMTYTGKPIEPKQSEITVTLNGIPLTAKDYKIVGYSNNLNTGTAKLTIQGQGGYGGTKTVTFKIKKKSLFAQLLG